MKGTHTAFTVMGDVRHILGCDPYVAWADRAIVSFCGRAHQPRDWHDVEPREETFDNETCRTCLKKERSTP